MASKKWHLDKELESLIHNYDNIKKGIELLNKFNTLGIKSHDPHVNGNYQEVISLIKGSLHTSLEELQTDIIALKKTISDLEE
jgi:hypothetical protein